MASSGKRKTTMAKLNRERRLVERRQIKAAKKDARKRAAALELESPGSTLREGQFGPEPAPEPAPPADAVTGDRL